MPLDSDPESVEAVKDCNDKLRTLALVAVAL